MLADVTGTLNACYFKLISTFFNSQTRLVVTTSFLLLVALLISDSSSPF